MTENERVEPATARYPVADMSAARFEEFVVGLFSAVSDRVTDMRVTLHEKITGVDGTYDFDATVRFTLGAMDFLVLVEAKKHGSPIKRELVQIFHSKILSVGAHKGAMISTAPYQSGALKFAKTHGIAVATVTEGRFTFEAKSVEQAPQLTREEASARYGLPAFVAHSYTAGDTPTSTNITLLSAEHPDYILEVLLGVSQEPR